MGRVVQHVAAILVTLCLCGAAAAQDRGTAPSPEKESAPTSSVTIYPRETEDQATERTGEQVVAGLSHDSVSITTNYSGTDILIYGAIKRESPIPGGAPLQVIVTIEAPPRPLTIWRKERKVGIWINTEKVEIGAAPGFYAVASSAPLENILDPDWDQRYRISLPLTLRAFAGQIAVDDAVPYTEALIRIRKENGLYRLDESAVTLVDQTLFRADLRLPATLIEGTYKIRIFLLRDGRVIDAYNTPIEVKKVGLERWLYHLAYEQPLLYGLMSLAVAVIAGWGASTIFRKLRRA